MNIKASLSPRKYSLIFLVIFALFFLFNVSSFFVSLCNQPEQTQFLSGVVNIDSTMDKINRIREVKKFQIQEDAKLAMEAKEIQVATDSLLNLSVKNHEDSIQILRGYKKMSIISNYLSKRTQ